MRESHVKRPRFSVYAALIGLLTLKTAILSQIAKAADVYDATGQGTYELFYSPAAPNDSFGDDLTLDQSIPAAERVIRQVSFAAVVPPNVTVPDADVLITFYATEDPAADGTTPALRNPLGSFRVHIAPAPIPPPTRFEYVDITNLYPDGIPMPDRGGISIALVYHDSFPPLVIPPPSACPALAMAPGGGGGGIVSPGSNDVTYFYRDGRHGSGYDPTWLNLSYQGAERTGFGGNFVNNNFLWLRLGNDHCFVFSRADANCDGLLNNFDIDCFVLALTNPAGWQAQCGQDGRCHLDCVADINRDGAIDNFDIDPFVQCLVGGC